MEKDVGDFIKDYSCTIAKSMLGREVSLEHENHAFLYVDVMLREPSRRVLVLEFNEKSGGISRVTNCSHWIDFPRQYF